MGFLSQKCNELYNSVLVLLAINKVPALNHGNRTIMLVSSAERLSQNWSGCSLILLRLVIEFNLIYKISTKCLISGNMWGQTILYSFCQHSQTYCLIFSGFCGEPLWSMSHFLVSLFSSSTCLSPALCLNQIIPWPCT